MDFIGSSHVALKIEKPPMIDSLIFPTALLGTLCSRQQHKMAALTKL